MTRLLVPVAFLVGSLSGAQWTVGVYICADNGLSDTAYGDLAELMRIGSTDEVNIVVQVDNAARDSNPGCRRYQVLKDGLRNLGDLGEVDMADTTTVADFARFIKADFPAENYFLVLWDHGSGWPEGYGPSRAILLDESHGHYMGVAGGELGAAVSAARRNLGKRLTVLGFDACLMGMLEVVQEVSDDCDYVLASEGLVPVGGWPYDEMLAPLVARPTAKPVEFLPQMCAAYVAGYPGEDVCLSGIDVRQFERLVPVARAALADSINPADEGLAQARLAVQTFSRDPGHGPCASDDQIDFVHFWELAPGPGIQTLRSVLGPAIISNRAAGAYGSARGVAVWFPDNYLGFKAQAESYSKLVWADSVPWLEFLNDYFGTDDVKPTQPEILAHKLGGRGDVRLWWSSSCDLAAVDYDLWEVAGPNEALVDYCDSFGSWTSSGWTTSERYAHSEPRSFFSGSIASPGNSLTLSSRLALGEGGLLSFYAFFETDEGLDSSRSLTRDPCYVEWSEDGTSWHQLDSLYGSARLWQERRYLLPPTGNPRVIPRESDNRGISVPSRVSGAKPLKPSGILLRFRYVTGTGPHGLGVFIDDIKVYSFEALRQVATAVPETSFYLFNLPKQGYHYLVAAADSFGNRSMVSQFYPVTVETYAEPYTRPAPFAGACELCLDFPESETPDVLVYTLSGTLVRRFQNVTSKVITWDGGNEAQKELADGLYLVVVQGKSFRKVGKIAKVGR